MTDPHPKPTVAVSVLLAIAQIMVWGGSFFMMAMLAGPVVKDTGWPQQWVYGSLSLGILISGLLGGQTRVVQNPACLVYSTGLALLVLPSALGRPMGLDALLKFDERRGEPTAPALQTSS